MRDATLFLLYMQRLNLFQSTHPMRDATLVVSVHDKSDHRISIHASHAGCDFHHLHECDAGQYFNPRIPCGMRLWTSILLIKLCAISIHASHAGCDSKRTTGRLQIAGISIHASHAGCDIQMRVRARLLRRHFNPRIPCGMRPGDG